MRKKYLKIRDHRTGIIGLAHRQVAVTLLGRSLLPGEVVHHLDGDSTNNAPENLLGLCCLNWRYGRLTAGVV
ncbi:hypothetical protein GCM10022631_24690 [Deinococcus rubellus]|uniref:HNH endonuclease n=1 Tax=Deinococcus rubellus TaxID=1889240 RepID=UPI0031E87AF5